MTDDAALLSRYAADGAQDAFAELVRRHVDFVYGIAVRQLQGNSALAEDVTQMVFIDLARKAAQLARHSALIGWLHTATRFAVARIVRGESRRKAREADDRAADAMVPGGPAPDWAPLQRVLDDVLGALKERERTAILLRFFEGKPLGEVGARLALSESATRACVDRALDKMRVLLARRGVTSTSAALGVALANQVSVAAPAGLAASVTTSALAGVVPAGFGAWGALFVMSKLKIGIVSAVIVGGLATAVVEVRANRELRAELATMRQVAPELERSQSEGRRLKVAFEKMGGQNPEVNELTRLQHRVTALKARPPGVVEAEMKPIVPAGRETPQAAFLTLSASMNAGDVDGVARGIAFLNDTPEAREAFMATLSPAVRARYGTPERVFAAGLFGMREGVPWEDPAVAAQVLGVEEREPGTMRVRMWIRQASGKESEIQEQFRRMPQGWVTMFRPLSYERDAAGVRSRFDPATGELRPRP
ncbi:MAG TPA: sigma-70 family RNA polymerase sigma factor [Opitutaceae bacterium]|nr:sigma-70 family RNA polymerase sigma factor [Opitutaceae bacterium]